MLLTVLENTFNGFSAYSLILTDLLAILSGILVIITKNPILSVLFLIALFASVSGHLILSGLNFLGLAYLLVYIGAVSILFLFILMLINVRISELFSDSINSIPLAILIGIFFIFFVGGALPLIEILKKEFPRLFDIELETVTSPIWDGNIAESSHITSIGNTLYGNYAMWLIITTVILLLAMVGCIVITLKDKNSNTGVTNNDSVPYSFTYMPLQSGIFTINKDKIMDIYSKLILFLFFNKIIS